MMGSDSCSFVISDEAGDDREVALGLFQAIREVWPAWLLAYCEPKQYSSSSCEIGVKGE